MFGLNNLTLLELGLIHEAEFMGVMIVITTAGSQLMNRWTSIRVERMIQTMLFNKLRS